MRTRYRGFVALVGVAFLSFSIQNAARAGVIDTEEYLNAVDRQATIAHIDSVLARDEVRTALERHGVDPAQASERVAALNDQELQTLATDLDNLPAGGSLLAVAGIVFIVLLILELVGVIDIFKKI
jgi:uncharacterized membrane protein (Fun14 family)